MVKMVTMTKAQYDQTQAELKRLQEEVISFSSMRDKDADTIGNLKSTVEYQNNTVSSKNEEISKLKKQIASQNDQYSGLTNFIGRMHKAIDIVRKEVNDFGQEKKPSYKFGRHGEPVLVDPPTPISADRQLGKVEGMLQGILAKYNIQEFENLEDMGATASPYAKNLPF